MSTLHGVYGGLVEEIADPDRMGRIKVRVPSVYGVADEVATNQLPWALPRGMPFGNSSESGGISWLPSKGDTVWVTFLDGEPEKPLWEWAIAPIKNGSYLHKYDDAGLAPKRAALTRYGHVIEFNPNSIIVTTPTGESAIFDTKNRTIQLQNSAKSIVKIDLDEVTVTAGASIVKVDGTGTQITALSTDVNLIGTRDISVVSSAISASAKKTADISAVGSVSIGSGGNVSISVGSNTVLLNKSGITVASGERTLSINQAGFLFA